MHVKGGTVQHACEGRHYAACMRREEAHLRGSVAVHQFQCAPNPACHVRCGGRPEPPLHSPRMQHEVCVSPEHAHVVGLHDPNRGATRVNSVCSTRSAVGCMSAGPAVTARGPMCSGVLSVPLEAADARHRRKPTTGSPPTTIFPAAAAAPAPPPTGSGGGVGSDVSCKPKLNTTKSHACGSVPSSPNSVVMFQHARPVSIAPVFEGACCSCTTVPFIAAARRGKYP
jgi:hypothetical protein